MATAPSPPFSAVLLAGGKSTRMGRDKAGLVIDGQPLWQRQLATLRATQPGELFISGKPDGPYAAAGLPVVLDTELGLGPLGGITAALRHARYEQVLVLAIDLPAVTAEFLSTLARTAASGAGVVSKSEIWFEPLAAIYPRSCLPLAAECLRGDDRSMQHFVRRAIAQGHLAIRELAQDELPLFRNVNHPSDF